MRIEMDLRNLRHSRLMEYLEQAGGVPTGRLAVQGPGWTARIVELEPVAVFSLTVKRDLLVIESDDQATLNRVHAFMRQKTMRGGG